MSSICAALMVYRACISPKEKQWGGLRSAFGSESGIKSADISGVPERSEAEWDKRE